MTKLSVGEDTVIEAVREALGATVEHSLPRQRANEALGACSVCGTRPHVRYGEHGTPLCTSCRKGGQGMSDEIADVIDMPEHLIADQLRSHIRAAEARRPRTVQTTLGPSTAGNPCARRIGYTLLETPEVNSSDPWPRIVGGATHTWLEQAFATADDAEDWLTEWPVEIHKFIPTGTLDLYHVPTGTVIDHKVIGDSAMKRYKASKQIPEGYLRQVMLYGYGLTLQGYDVKRVAVAFHSRSGLLRAMHVMVADYDQQTAIETIERVEKIGTVAEVHGNDAPALLPNNKAEWCLWCPFYKPGATDLSLACPGNDNN